MVFPQETWALSKSLQGFRCFQGQRNMDKGDAQSISIAEKLPAKHKSLLDSAAAPGRC